MEQGTEGEGRAYDIRIWTYCNAPDFSVTGIEHEHENIIAERVRYYSTRKYG